MKKTILSIGLLLSTVGCFAQLDENTFFITPKVGANVSCTHDRQGDLQYDNWKPDFMLGVGFGYQFNDKWAVTADILYCEQGVRDKNTGPIWASIDGVRAQYDFEDVTTNFNYINVPIMANFYIAEGLAIKAGVQFGYLTHASDKMTVNYKGSPTQALHEKYNENITNMCNKFDIAIPIGISYDLENNLQLDLRYNYGLTKNLKKEFEDYGQCKNQAVTLTLGYVFAL